MKKFILTLLLIIAANSNNRLEAVCLPHDFAGLTVLTKMCHTCIFPLTISGITLLRGPMPDPSPTSVGPICLCTDPFPRVGIPISFFEPSRIMEVVSDAFCFPTLGIDMGSVSTGMIGGTKGHRSTQHNTFMQVHYMIFPIYAQIELIVDFLCLESTGVDYAYITEVDPLWNSDTTSAFMYPEALLFGSPVTNLACIADSVASSAGYPLDPLFWCMGSWGNSYPLTGHKDTTLSFVQDTAAIAARMIYKLHRELILWGSFGNKGLCGYYPMPIWLKTAYRLQIIDPVPNPIAMPIGETGLMWDYLKDIPNSFDNFGYLLFKKRDCCVL
jgi:conjugal transfer pilus assembly protein TraU